MVGERLVNATSPMMCAQSAPESSSTLCLEGSQPKMNRVWLIADTHFCHHNIIDYCGRPADHNELMVANWQRLVSEKDLVYHLGDIAFCSKERAIDIFKALPGRKILVRGNHDKKAVEYYQQLGFREVHKHPLIIPHQGNILVLSHEPIPKEALIGLLPRRDVPFMNVHGHIHNSEVDWAQPPMYRNVSVEMTNYSPVLLGASVYESPTK
jgi:calcineurin-like phosphoesterase family protein